MSFSSWCGETGRQAGADLQALPGGGQEQQWWGLLRGLPVSHAQGDSSAPELGASGPPPSPLALYSEAL